MNNPEQHSTPNRRKQTSASMALGIGVGLTLGAALHNIAAGLAIGILLGGIGSLWRTKKANGDPERKDKPE